MNSLKKEFDDYLKSFTTQNLDQNFWLPQTKVGIHLLEQTNDVIKQRGDPLREKSKRIVQGLKQSSIATPSLPLKKSLDLHALIKSWETLSHFEASQEAELIKTALSFQALHKNHFYATLFNDVFEEMRVKRNFRLHFKRTYLPMSLNYKGQHIEMACQLKSISYSGLLLKLDPTQRSLLEEGASLAIAVYPRELFRTRNPEVENIFSMFSMERNFWGLYKKIPTVKVDKENLRFSRCHIEASLFGDQDDSSFCHIPFEAMKDIINDQPSKAGEQFKRYLDGVEDAFTELALA